MSLINWDQNIYFRILKIIILLLFNFPTKFHILIIKTENYKFIKVKILNKRLRHNSNCSGLNVDPAIKRKTLKSLNAVETRKGSEAKYLIYFFWPQKAKNQRTINSKWVFLDFILMYFASGKSVRTWRKFSELR